MASAIKCNIIKRLCGLLQSLPVVSIGLAFLLGGVDSVAAEVTLTPAQQQLLNQLPPSQRAAALSQLQQLRQAATSSTSKPETENQDLTDLPSQELDVSELAKLPPRFAPGDTAIINVSIDETSNLAQVDSAAQAMRRDRIAKIKIRNPYKLNELGRLELPGIEPIDLAGLTEEQSTMRLRADPALEGLDVSIALLPLTPVGAEAVKPFGYDLFDSVSTGTKSDLAISVPANYVLGPGDVLQIQLFGNKSAEYELRVARDGSIQFPELGPISVAGLSFDQLRELVDRTVKEKLIGTQVSLTLGSLRSVQVFLVGDVNKPGVYTVGALSTVTTVLSVGGGVAPQGSLRNIQLKRNGELVGTLDIYSLLLGGDTRGDQRVQAGDVVFVPPVGPRVSILGQVKRPAVYELRSTVNVKSAIDLAGGLSPNAYRVGARIERVAPKVGRLTIDVDLDALDGQQTALHDGDTLLVPAGIVATASSVTLVGNVERPGPYEWREGLRLSDIISDRRDVKPGSDLNYLLIRRETQPNAPPTVLSADLEAAWRGRGGAVDLSLLPRDTVYVFDVDIGREQIIGPLIRELQLSSSLELPLAVVTIGGSVNAAGEFPLEHGMRVTDLVRAGGGLSQSAYTYEAELTRYQVTDEGTRATSVTSINLGAAMSGDILANIELQPFDYLNIRTIPNWGVQKFVEVRGEVEFPGRYPIKNGETLSSIVERAGGLSALAFPEGSIFTREALKEREREQLDVLATRIQSDLASLQLSEGAPLDTATAGQSLIRQLRESEPTGRLVIDLSKTLDRDANADLIVRDGDVLLIPQRPQEVTVLGEVQYTTSHVFSPNLMRADYIAKSGGTTAKADKRRIYVVRASGEVVAASHSRFFARSTGIQIEPGDTIVVPLDVERIRPLTLWTSATQIIYNLAIAATAIQRF